MQRMTPLLGPFAPLFSLADRCRLGKASKRQLEGYGEAPSPFFKKTSDKEVEQPVSPLHLHPFCLHQRQSKFLAAARLLVYTMPGMMRV